LNEDHGGGCNGGRIRVILALAAGSWGLAACSDSGAPSMLDPAGPGARRIEGLWWLMFWISLAVFAVVLLLLLISLLRARRNSDALHSVAWGEPFIVVAGVVVPAFILAGVFLVSLREMNALASYGEDARLTIEVIGHDWWWEVRYPNGAVTANEIHIPAAEPVRLELTTDDVLHSFWVPELQAKTDMINGRTNRMWIEADEAGRSRGQCAEFCGLQHANMAFYVIAQERTDFDAWLEKESAPAARTTDSGVSRGEQIFLSSTCVGCHAVRGTPADSQVGPDLTHVARRETLAAGTITNTRANLAQWVLDPQSIKPGAPMPPTDLSSEELEALLDYLESLD
jgi:cytochrome c oxidase subunit II